MTINEYIKQDRQWTRDCRIAAARANLMRATTTEDRKFWRAIMEANGAR